jgi:hypothetical protein
MAIDRKRRVSPSAAIANSSKNGSESSSSYHRRNSNVSNNKRNDDSEPSALTAAGALLGLASCSKDTIRQGKKTDDGLRHSTRRYRNGSNSSRPLLLQVHPNPILPRHFTTEISDDEDENLNRRDAMPYRSTTTFQVNFHNYNNDNRRGATRIPGVIGNSNRSVASQGWVGRPLGPPPRLPLRKHNVSNVGAFPDGSPIYMVPTLDGSNVHLHQL